jgi:hypothetical protein
MHYQPSLDSIQSHPLPDWFHNAKLGIFVTWGLYNMPAFAPLKKRGMSDEEAGMEADENLLGQRR